MTNEQAFQEIQDWIKDDGVGRISIIALSIALNALKIQIDNPETIIQSHWIDECQDDEAGNGLFTCPVCQHTDAHSRKVEVPYCWFCGTKMIPDANDSKN